MEVVKETDELKALSQEYSKCCVLLGDLEYHTRMNALEMSNLIEKMKELNLKSRSLKEPTKEEATS